MARFTRNDLNAQIKSVNARLERFNSPYFFAAEGRNGYTAIDLYRRKPDGSKGCLHSIAQGTPAQCNGKLYETAFDYLNEAAQAECRRLAGVVSADDLAAKGHL